MGRFFQACAGIGESTLQLAINGQIAASWRLDTIQVLQFNICLFASKHMVCLRFSGSSVLVFLLRKGAPRRMDLFESPWSFVAI